MKKNLIEESLLEQILSTEIPDPTRELQFHPTRKWRFDFAWKRQKIAAEVMGGVWSGGGHVRPYGYEADCEKLNEAVKLGWTVFYFTTKMVKDGRALEWLKGMF